MSSRLNKSNTNLLDLSLTGSPLNSNGSFSSNTCIKKLNSRPTSASSNRSYIIPRPEKVSSRPNSSKTQTPNNSARANKPP
jgi:hypothetical protein